MDRHLLQKPVDCPGDPDVYEQIVMHGWDSHLEWATRAARQLCVLAPDIGRHRRHLLVLLQRAERWDEIDRNVPRGRRPLPQAESHPVNLDGAAARHQWLMAQQSERADEGWTPSKIEGNKRRTPLPLEHLSQFRRSEVSGGTQMSPDRPGSFPSLDFSRLYPPYDEAERNRALPILHRQRIGLLSRLYRHQASGIDWYDAAVLDDGRFGGRTIELPGAGPVTAKSLQAAYYACRLVSLVPRNGVVLEVGGGFGAVAARLLAIRPDITYVLTDLPVNMVLTHTYLTSLYGDAVAGLWEDSDWPAPGQRALVVPPWRLAALPLKVDLAVNTMSFQHMDERNHAFYGGVLKALGTRFLYHVNRIVHIGNPATDTMAIPADDYAFMADYEVVDRHSMDHMWIEVVARARA